MFHVKHALLYCGIMGLEGAPTHEGYAGLL